ncbi:hypothetical protein [Aquisphaera insulae]|uniref:hypothetical protein n=1 Tax=Aquisphaera insulae TaxID=2712864 RepID=UPI0013EABC67|nr:hypothetical protein [Aquisphaera insulae]
MNAAHRLSRIGPIALVLGMAWSSPAHSDEPAKPKVLVVSPAAAPIPSLRYRLLPLRSELNPGNAAPVYLRIRHGQRDAVWEELEKNYKAWIEVPLKDIPLAEAETYLRSVGSFTRMLRIGAWRESCDWGYPLRELREEAIWITLPDAQNMRQLSRLLQLKARVEVAGGNHERAVDTMETCMALGRHVAEGPFLINALIGQSICMMTLDEVEELIARPDAPNLYWALSALPRPLVDLRPAFETDQRLIEGMIPEMSGADDPRPVAEWDTLLDRLYDRIRKLASEVTSDPKANAAIAAQLPSTSAAFKQASLATSREYQTNVLRRDPATVARMSDAEVVVRSLVARYRDVRDDLFRLGYLSWREAKPFREGVELRRKVEQSGALAALLEPSPTLSACLDAPARADRRVAILRTIEAIRLHAASHDGALPKSLDAIEDVPVPADPCTGKPFLYALQGTSAGLRAEDVGHGLNFKVDYRITVRSPSPAK